MIMESTSKRPRSAAAIALAVSVVLPALCAAQDATPPAAAAGAQTAPAAPAVPARAPSVYSNPRAGADDPRIGLKGGLTDAAEAASGMQRIATLPKPAGFAPGEATPPAPIEPTPEQGAAGRGGRGPAPIQYGSTNSDLAFSGNHLFVGNYNGINMYDIDNPGQIKLRTSILCPGGQGDVSVYGHLLFMSAEAMNGRVDCGKQGIPLPEGYKPPPPPPAPAPGTAGGGGGGGGGL